LRQQSEKFQRILETAAHGTLKINSESLRQIKIPLPPLATQNAIAAELEAEQSLVAANRELIERFEKKIQDSLARVWGEDASTDAEAESANGFRDHAPGVAAGALAGGAIVAGSSKAL